MSAMTWTIILIIASACWLLMWLFTRPKGGKDGNKD